MKRLELTNPKQDRRLNTPWDAFFPYYAGYPQRFASLALSSLNLPNRSVVLDPWNGSGTTPYAAERVGLDAVGLDINPVMVVVAKARLLPSSEASSLSPLGRQVLNACVNAPYADHRDPLCVWFVPRSAGLLRAIEQEIRRLLIGNQLRTGDELGAVSCIASALYVALFSVTRLLVAEFRSSNPTWVRSPKKGEAKISVPRKAVVVAFEKCLAEMADALAKDDRRQGDSRINIGMADSTCLPVEANAVDVVLTSPPYCTRIDYATTTRVELAVLSGLLPQCHVDLGRQMLGSVRVPNREIEVRESWGEACHDFLQKVSTHTSKASSGYYLKTHLDYFDKLDRSLGEISRVLKHGAPAILVVQDSFYKDIHNDVPLITVQASAAHGLRLRQRVDFPLKKSMAAINKAARMYREKATAVEAVLCFQKEDE